MPTAGQGIQTIADYVAALPAGHRPAAETLRAVIRAAMPESTEALRYGLPAFLVDGRAVIHFGFWSRHIGLYPVYRGDPAFEAALAPFRSKKDTVRLPLDQPIPEALVEMIVRAQRAAGA